MLLRPHWRDGSADSRGLAFGRGRPKMSAEAQRFYPEGLSAHVIFLLTGN